MGVAMVTRDGLPMRIWLRTWLAMLMLAVVMRIAFAVVGLGSLSLMVAADR